MFCPVMEKLPGSFLVGVAVVPAIWFSFAGFFLCVAKCSKVDMARAKSRANFLVFLSYFMVK